ncbi:MULTISPECIES: hypothetical protein [Bacillus]|uniref:Uncharacterized protein n=1 Tax=Bacillus thuringiensis T01-328 TaxID=1324966 RepID=A0AAN4KQU0_BACTU|nr:MULTISPECIES: hypothetical protein [Bacillus]MEC0046221.1 hypothetical protein [Bacillus cereus]AFV21584.1 hypothetical protein BTB_502p02790 [Bacillus thuringiensis Bt407]EEM25386.1 hypothetical protein bthur0002_60280 [Bacillus thuringiensis Bt407]ERI01240.1 hypothetical protein BTCBT_002795 [Bacillus thuringiensis T01-328]MEC2682072.1 hypothetical protein [Bacillus thuringiensis]
MDKYNVYGNGEPEKTKYEYEIGEVIMLYTSNGHCPIKCINKKVVDGKLIQYFNKGRLD